MLCRRGGKLNRRRKQRKEDCMNCTETMRKKNRFIDWAVFTVVLVLFSALTLTLFGRQVYGDLEHYHSDMKAYILEMQGLDSGYSFPYPVFFKLAALIHFAASPEMAVAISAMLLNSLSLVITKLAFNRLLCGDGRKMASGSTGTDKGGEDTGLSVPVGIAVSLFSASLFFISMLYPPDGIYLPGIKFKNIGVFSPNPFHNATYMAARPFAILAFLWYGKLLPVYENGVILRAGKGREILCGGEGKKQAALKDYMLFSLFLLIATMTKPSFTLVMVSTAGLIMLYRLIRAKFQNFVPTIQLGVCFIPTFTALLYQYRGVFMPEDGEEGGIGFCFGEVWAQYCDNIPLAVCLAIGFPLLVLVLNFRECRKNSLFRFSWQLYLVGFAEAFLLYEKGFRKVDFNFSWGYMYGIFFCHFGALLLLLQKTAGRSTGNSGKKERLLLILQWLAYLWHLACGIYYFWGIFLGGTYY